jgi:hypothetical protein
MLSLEEVLEEQRALDRLCADRTLETVELFEWNAFYGHAAILKAITGLPVDRPLFVTLPHGVTFLGRPNAAELHANIGTAYSYQREYDEALSIGGARMVIRGAAPFTYLPHLLGPAPAHRSGVLYFPSHSTRYTTVEAGYDRLAEMLCALPAHLGPVRVCCYYMDVLRGHHRPFLERGIPVYSAGHQYDPLFLVRLWHLMSMHRHVMSNAHGTHLAYAMFAGCSFTFLDTPDARYVAAPGYEDWVITAPPAFKTLHDQLFADGRTCDDVASRAAAVDLIGAARQLPPERLRQLLVAADRREQLRRSAGVV